MLLGIRHRRLCPTTPSSAVRLASRIDDEIEFSKIDATLSVLGVCDAPSHFCEMPPLPFECRVSRAGSAGQRNTCSKSTRRSLETQGLSRSFIQAQRDLVEVRLRIGKTPALGDVFFLDFSLFRTSQSWPDILVLLLTGRRDAQLHVALR
jgi:hypothetical protein